MTEHLNMPSCHTEARPGGSKLCSESSACRQAALVIASEPSLRAYDPTRRRRARVPNLPWPVASTTVTLSPASPGGGDSFGAQSRGDRSDVFSVFATLKCNSLRVHDWLEGALYNETTFIIGLIFKWEMQYPSRTIAGVLECRDSKS